MKAGSSATWAASLSLLLGAGCSSPRTEVTACSIDGELIPDGTRNPQNQCQVCRAKNAASAWSNIAAGTSCGDGSGSFCAGGSCQAGCYIDSIFYPSAAPDPSNSCLACEPALNATNWSPITGVPPVGACPQNGVCFQGHCQPGCTIGTTQVPAGTPNPDNFCQSCQPGQGASTWTDKPPGATCADGGAICAKGNCTAGCEVDGVFYNPGGPSPDNVCQTCQPKESISSFSPATGLAPGGTCGNGSYCYKGQCSGGCAIGGTSYAPGDTDPANACLGCDPTVSAITWSSVDPGTPCAGSGVCSGGTCLFGCQIGGLLFPPGTDDPAQVCQSCQPAVSPTDWSPLTGIPTDGCAGGQVCLDGGCAVGCFIKKTYYTTGTRTPGDTSQCCSPTADPAHWSPAFAAGTSLLIGAGNSNGSEPILVADFNRDGLSDIAVLGFSPFGFQTFINQGDGGFSTSSLSSVSAGTGATGDLDGDGYPDLALAIPNISYYYNYGYSYAFDYVDVLMNQRDGGFSAPTSFALNVTHYDAGPDDAGGATYYYTSYYYYTPGAGVALSDVNRDGVLDAVAVGGAFSGNASVLLGIGDGGFQPGRAIDTGLVSSLFVAVADFNSDGWPDLLVLGDTAMTYYGYGNAGSYVDSYDPRFSLILSDGSGGFGSPISLAVSGIPSGFAVADFNGDGIPDLVVGATTPYAVQILTGIGDGSFSAPTYYLSGSYYYSYGGIVVGDFNGDSRPDFIVNGYGPILFLNNGDGGFTTGNALTTYYTSAAPGHFLGGGPDDLAAVSGYNGALTPYFNNCR